MVDYSGYEHILAEHDGNILTLTLNRPDRMNAVNGRLHTGLSTIFREVNRDNEAWAVILTGAGRAFCAGGDVGGMASSESGSNLEHRVAEVRGVALHRGAVEHEPQLVIAGRVLLVALEVPQCRREVGHVRREQTVVEVDRARLSVLIQHVVQMQVSVNEPVVAIDGDLADGLGESRRGIHEHLPLILGRRWGGVAFPRHREVTLDKPRQHARPVGVRPADPLGGRVRIGVIVEFRGHRAQPPHVLRLWLVDLLTAEPGE